jgi:hypothetical protein
MPETTAYGALRHDMTGAPQASALVLGGDPAGPSDESYLSARNSWEAGCLPVARLIV